MSAIGPTPGELADAIAAYEAHIPSGHRFSFDISALDTVGLSVIMESFTGWPIGSNDGFGYGATTEEARVGALGELCEDIAVSAALSREEGERGSYEAMATRHGSDRVADPLTLCLPAGSDYAPERTLSWVLCRRWPDGEMFVPREFVASRPNNYGSGHPAPLALPITNGLGAGLTLEQALAHGVLELLQRDGNAVRFRAMDRGIVIDIDGVADPGVRSLVALLRSHGIEPMAKLACTDFGLTNLYVVDGGAAEPPFALQATACGEAAHASPVRALRKALLEFMAARCRKAMMHGPLGPIERIAPPDYMTTTMAAANVAREEPRALREMAAWVERSADELRQMLRGTVLSQRRRIGFADLPGVADEVVRDPRARLADLAARLEAAGFPLLFYDATGPHSDVRVVRAVVPGLECETMSYHRIAARGVEKLIEDDTGLAGIGPPPTGTAPVRLTAAAQEALGGPAWLDTAGIDRAVGPLYPLYREPASHTVQLALRRTDSLAEPA